MIMQNKANFSKPKMVVTLVITMTNNNEQRTANYSKQTQSNPTCGELVESTCGEQGRTKSRSRLGFSEWLLPVDVVFV
jgi:hypothetical protein